MPFYMCGEFNGDPATAARLLQAHVGHTRVTPGSTMDVLLDVATWDAVPAGPVGDCVFRAIDVTVRHDQGVQMGVTPIVDGVTLAEHLFDVPAPAAGDAGPTALQAFLAARGSRIAARIRQTAATGTVELVQVGVEYTVVRVAP